MFEAHVSCGKKLDDIYWFIMSEGTLKLLFGLLYKLDCTVEQTLREPCFYSV